MRALIVVDLGFGDAGKGLLTDVFVRETGARTVVRYNGGAQAGHNVVTPDGRHHTFAQFGAGTFVPGVRTVLSRHVLLHPTALLGEARALAAKRVEDALDRLTISAEALLITPFHQAAGRLREIARGAARHGSCGVGVGEAVRDSLAEPAGALRAAHLAEPAILHRRVLAARSRLRETLDPATRHVPEAAAEWEIFTAEEVASRWCEAAAVLAPRVTAEAAIRRALAAESTVVFEGAQGVLLDEDLGFHPYTTWSRTTPHNADEIAVEAGATERLRFGVLRAHAVRHGPGPFPTEDAALAGAITEHNRPGPWQGPVRYGWFDGVLARYALAAIGGVDGFALTHCDLPLGVARWRVATAYAVGGAHEETLLASLPPAAPGLAARERLTTLLQSARPRYTECAADADAVRGAVAEVLGRPVDWTATGPTAGHLVRLSGGLRL